MGQLLDRFRKASQGGPEARGGAVHSQFLCPIPGAGVSGGGLEFNTGQVAHTASRTFIFRNHQFVWAGLGIEGLPFMVSAMMTVPG